MTRPCRAREDASPGPAGLMLAELALVVGLLYAAISVYWGLGGTWLLSTVGGTLENQGRAGDTGVLFADGLPWYSR